MGWAGALIGVPAHPRHSELPSTLLLGNSVNKGIKKGRGILEGSPGPFSLESIAARDAAPELKGS